VVLWLGIGALAVVFLEIALIVKVAAVVGFPLTFLLLIALSAGGAWIVKREGLSALRRIRGGLQAGRVPTTEVIDAALIVLAGALLLPPGFFTGVIGLLLVIPPVRSGVRLAAGAGLQAYVSRRLRRAGATEGDVPPRTGRGSFSRRANGSGPGAGGPRSPRDGDVIDIDGEEVDLFGPSPELGPPLGG
jgi:UPF0716 protein FxsA